MAIQTVCGIIKKESAGITSPHEHIFIELSPFFDEHFVKDCPNPATAKVTMDKLGILYRDPYAIRDDLVIDDFKTQKKEISRFKTAGGQTIVDATMPGIGRNPRLLKKISEQTGVNVVMGTGFYVYSSHPQEMKNMTENEIAELMVKEIQEGVGDTGIKAGIIGEIGISEIFNEEERRVLRASAVAHKKTGTSVLVHINPWTTNGIEAAKILLDAGVDPKKITISHVDVENNVEYISELLRLGVYVEFDNFGKEYYVNREVRNSGYGLFVNDVQRVKCLKRFIDEGYKKQILCSCDVCLKICLRKYGGWGYDHVLTNIVPMMEDEGISKEDIALILKENPTEFIDNRKLD